MLGQAATKLLEIGFLLLMILALVGCKIDGEEEIEIHADGALTMRVNYQFPELGLSLEEGKALVIFIREFGSRHDSITVNELSCVRAGNATVRLIAEVHSSDATKLREIIEEEAKLAEKIQRLDQKLLTKLNAIIGNISIGLEGKKIKYKRTMTFDDVINDELPRLNPDLLGNYRFRYSLTTPSPATDHNADTVSNGGKTLTWVMPLKDHIHSPYIMQSSIPIPLPWWLWMLICFVLLVLLLLVIKCVSFVRRKWLGSRKV